MQIKFLHAADIHLGYQQYGLPERYDDFADAFQWVVNTALEERVDFLLIAGDLFEKRTLDPRTLLIAVIEFERLQEAGIPVVAIEGNHERSYGDSFSWLEYLNQRDLLYLLDCSRREESWQLQLWNQVERTGGYVDLAGARVYGLRYQGAQTGAALNEIGSAIAAAPPHGAAFSVFVAHTSVEGYFDQGHPFARQQDLASLRRCIDYLALGHVHAPYKGVVGNGDWFYNPGSPESWSSEEWQYQSKGAFLVQVDTDREPTFKAEPRNYPGRRPFVRIRQELDACPSPGVLMRLLEEKIQREPLPSAVTESEPENATPQGISDNQRLATKSPVVEIVLTGVARFARTEIDTAAIEQLARKHFDPLLVRVRSTLQEAPTSVVEDGHVLPREVLERTVIEDLIRADDRYASAAGDLGQSAILLKQMVLDGVPAAEIADELQRRLRVLSGTGRDGVQGQTVASLQERTASQGSGKDLTESAPAAPPESAEEQAPEAQPDETIAQGSLIRAATTSDGHSSSTD